ncbi:MAG: peroxidase family protein [Reyranella sp.]|uniref:peroxidase family protein n=1 Tax=Reyranella sp. TaxID=1929291 RepID=UPI003D0DE4EC
MGVLAGLMATENEGPELIKKLENPDLPSGYTYLLQLVAHDCVRTSTPFWALSNPRAQARNARTGRLRLDTIYDDGPSGCPFAYEPDDRNDTSSRSRLRLGRMRSDPMRAEANGPLRDIGRLASQPMDAPNGAAPGNSNEPWIANPSLTEVLLADSRNDDNVLVSQMTALFHMLHNTLLGVIDRSSEPGEWRGDMEKRFACARAATTMIYRRIVRDDLLHRLLQPDVHKRYQAEYEAGGSRGTLECGPGKRGGTSVPLEFSHGAFRFAHSMIRPAYQTGAPAAQPLSQALRRTSTRAPGSMPLDASWILPWGRFFRLEGGSPEPNLSLKIGPRYTGTLDNAAWFPSPLPPAEAAKSSPGVRTNGVALQDLLSAALSGVSSVQPLYAALQSRIAELGWGDLLARSKLADEETRRAVLAGWMNRPRHATRPNENDVAALAADPPLPFYVMFEAEHEEAGLRLGRLGSLIVAEVLYRAMLDDPLPGEIVTAPLQDNLARLSLSTLGKGALAAVPEIRDMAGLVGFIADQNRLRGATPAFI